MKLVSDEWYSFEHSFGLANLGSSRWRDVAYRAKLLVLRITSLRLLLNLFNG